MRSIDISRLLRPAAALLAVTALTACGVPHFPPSQPAPPASTAGITAAGDVLTRAQIDMINPSRMTDLIEGRLAGVQVLDVGSREELVIRGYPDPLIVVDGTPLPDSESFWLLNPRDIERIRIIKDGGEAQWGSRGAHGVVLLTTRKE